MEKFVDSFVVAKAKYYQTIGISAVKDSRYLKSNGNVQNLAKSVPHDRHAYQQRFDV